MKQATVSRITTMRLVGRGVWLELLRRQDLYVCGMVMLVFMLGVLIMRIVGIDNPATGTFMLNMGLSLASICAHVLLLLLAIRQLPLEIENRTLYTLLARPVRRADVVLAKWLAVGMGGAMVYSVLVLLAWGSVPKLEFYDAAMLGQMLMLQVLSLLVLAGFCVALSLALPRGLAFLVGVGTYFGGGSLRRVIGQGSGVRRILAAYIPDWGMLDATTRYTDGIEALGVGSLGALLGYGAIMLVVFLVAAIALFERRRL